MIMIYSLMKTGELVMPKTVYCASRVCQEWSCRLPWPGKERNVPRSRLPQSLRELATAALEVILEFDHSRIIIRQQM
jgi:hypothetical protein